MDTTIDKYDYWLLRKPLQSDTIAENVLQHGVGGLNIDKCRVEGAPSLPGSSNIRAVNDRAMGAGWDQTASARAEAYRANPPSGRWPANLIHDGSEEVTELFPEVKGSKGSGLTQTKARSWKNTSTAGINRVGHDDSGSAARFFYNVTQDSSISEGIDQGDVMDTDNEDLERQFHERVMLYLGNCLDVLKTMESNSVDSIVTDPPAGISFMNKHWDTDHGHRDQWIAYFAEIAKECLRVIKPGGHALVWAIPRTSHWTATAWENGGWEVRDRIIYCFGSGFPKSHNISKAIDKLAGAEREVVGSYAVTRNISTGSWADLHGKPNKATTVNLTAPATDAAKQWDGWGTALKPAVEDWWLLRKPLSNDTIAENVLEHGVGGLNIDGCRVGTGDDRISGGLAKEKFGINGMPQTNRPTGGRWPANIITDGSEEVTELFPEVKGSKGDEKLAVKGQSGIYGWNTAYKDKNNSTSNKTRGVKDSGSASRFFYTAKASKSDRNEGLSETLKNTHATVKPTALMQYLCRLITPPDGIVLDPFMGSGSTGKACMLEGFRFIGIDMEEEYVVIARARIIHALKPEVQEYYKKKQSKGGKVKEVANEEANEEGDLS